MGSMDFSTSQPIYLQIMNRIVSEIVRGERKLGDKLPSVREFAVEVGVNVNTIQRVYRELEMEKIVETKRGQGTFVTENEHRLSHLREEKKQEIVHQFVHSMKEMGYNVSDMVESIRDYKEDLI